MKKILILGATGLVGHALVQMFNQDYKIFGLSRHEVQTDLFESIVYDHEKNEIGPILTEIHPDIIISCTRGEFEAQLNTHYGIAEYAKENNIKVYFFSTANVFDGDPSGIKYESSEVCAESDYGTFKIACEKILFDALESNAVILRLPMVMGDTAPRVETIKRALITNEKVQVHDNLMISTIYDQDIAVYLKYIIENAYDGIFHLASIDVINQEDFYTQIFESEKYLEVDHLEEHDPYYLAVVSERSELDEYSITNEDVIRRIKKLF